MEVVNAIGRRKAAVARVYVSEGKGNIVINKKRSVEEYFTLPTLQCIVKQPLELLGVSGHLTSFRLTRFFTFHFAGIAG